MHIASLLVTMKLDCGEKHTGVVLLNNYQTLYLNRPNEWNLRFGRAENPYLAGSNPDRVNPTTLKVILVTFYLKCSALLG